MINKNMFFTEPRLNDYHEMDVEAILREHLLTKGTRCRNLKGEVEETNHTVAPADIVPSGLFLYGLKYNTTNSKAVIYYSIRWAQRNQYLQDGQIRVPDNIWQECDRKNEEFTSGRDRNPQ